MLPLLKKYIWIVIVVIVAIAITNLLISNYRLVLPKSKSTTDLKDMGA